MRRLGDTTPSFSGSWRRALAVTVQNKRGITPLDAAMFGSTTGRGRPAAPAGADALGFEPPITIVHPSAVALLKTLGAAG